MNIPLGWLNDFSENLFHSCSIYPAVLIPFILLHCIDTQNRLGLFRSQRGRLEDEIACKIAAKLGSLFLYLSPNLLGFVLSVAVTADERARKEAIREIAKPFRCTFCSHNGRGRVVTLSEEVADGIVTASNLGATLSVCTFEPAICQYRFASIIHKCWCVCYFRYCAQK